MAGEENESLLARLAKAIAERVMRADKSSGPDVVNGSGFASGRETIECLPSPSEIAEEPSPRPSSSNETFQTAAIEPETFAEQVIRRRQESNQGGDANGDNERLRGRSLPDEQRERDKGRGR